MLNKKKITNILTLYLSILQINGYFEVLQRMVETNLQAETD